MDAGGRTGVVLTIIRSVSETGSTNADLLALAATGVEEGVWLRAERQSAGRGRQGRIWVSEPGNLYASTLVRLRPTDPAAATLALMAGIAVQETVSAYLPDCRPGEHGPSPSRSLTLKWPNDLLLAGAKLAGILLERQGDAVVAGIGVNLAHHPVLADRPTTSLTQWGSPVDPGELVDTLAGIFSQWLERWRSEGLAAIRRAWLDRAHPVGTALTARLPDGTAVDGLFDGLDPDGALMLRLASGERRVIHAADILLL